MILQSIKWHRAHSQWDERKSCVQSEGHSSREGKLDPQHGSNRPLSPSPNPEILVVELASQRAVRTVGASLPWWVTQKAAPFPVPLPQLLPRTSYPYSPHHLLFPESSSWHSTQPDGGSPAITTKPSWNLTAKNVEREPGPFQLSSPLQPTYPSHINDGNKTRWVKLPCCVHQKGSASSGKTFH